MLKELSRTSLIIGAVNSQEPIAADKIFVAVDSHFKKWGLGRDEELTPETRVNVYQSREPATFVQIFGSLVRGDIDDLCLTLAQIEKFCDQYRELFDDPAFFLMRKKVNPFKMFWRWLNKTLFGREIRKRLFVAVMRPCVIGIRAEIEHFEKNEIWGEFAPYRIVVRAPENLGSTAGVVT
jgi:hypothetical protein